MTSQLRFPNISVRESVIGPIPFQSYWRNTIGVAAIFNRGPVGPITLNSREDFAYLYGEDASPGSVAIRQALLQGATNFTISRIMPSSKPSYGTIALQGSSPLTQEAFVGIGDDRTVGLEFQASYVSPAVRSEGEFLGDTVQVADSSNLNFTDFEGVGTFDFEFVEKIDVSAVVVSAPITLDAIAINAANTDIQVITASGASGSELRDRAKPGLIINVDGTDVSGATFDGPPGTGSYLTILSYAYESADGEFSCVVQGQVLGSAAPIIVNVDAASPVGPDHFTIRYSYLSSDGAELTDDVWEPKNFLPNANVTSLGFLVLTENDRSQRNLNLITDVGGALGLFDTGIVIAFGDASSQENLEFVIGSQFQTAISSGSASIGENDVLAPNFPNTANSFIENQSVLELFALLRNAIASDVILSGLIADFEINEITLPYSLTFMSAIEGSPANRIRYTLTRTIGGGAPTDILFGAAGADYAVEQSMTGAVDSMRISERVLYDINGNPLVLIQALSPGVGGNRLRISVRPQPPGRFSLEITDEDATVTNTPTVSETLTLSNFSVDQQSGLYMASIDSNLIRAFFLPLRNNPGIPLTDSLLNLTPQRLAPPVQTVTDIENPMNPAYRGVSFLTNFYLERGSNSPNYDAVNPAEEDVLAAIRRLEDSDLAMIMMPGIKVSDSRYENAVSELILQAERSNTTNGLRIAILQAPPRMTAGRAPSVTAGITSKRAIVVTGHVSMPGTRSLGANAVPVDGLYAGQLAVIDPHVSPAAVSGGHILNGVQTSDTGSSNQFLNAITEARMDTLFRDPGLGLFKFLNGITASTDANERYVSIRRFADQLIMDLYTNLQWVRSSPHTPSLRTRVASAVDAHLNTLVREERMLSFRPTVCDDSNNTISDVSQGRMNILITYTPVFPADFIRLDLVRDLTAELTLSTN